MIKSNRNQLANCHNSYQGQHKRVLCVCSAGLLRSPTIASVLHSSYGFNTRACGSSMEYALIPISEVLVEWADEIVFADLEHYVAVQEHVDKSGKPYVILGIPDQFNRMDPELVEHVKRLYDGYLSKAGEEKSE